MQVSVLRTGQRTLSTFPPPQLVPVHCLDPATHKTCVTVFFPPLLQDTCSVVSDYDCPCAEVSGSVEDLPGLGPLRDPEFFRDLQEASKSPEESKAPAAGQLGTPDPDLAAPALASSRYPADDPHLTFMVSQLRPRPAAGYIIDGEEQDPTGGPSLTIDLNGLLETMDTRMGSEQETQHADADLDADTDSFPILVRSMSTSRRHSWGVPLSPLNLGRR